VSGDKGHSWTELNPGNNGSGDVLVIDPSNSDNLYYIYPDIIKSTTAGQSWERLENVPPAACYQLAVDPTSSDKLYGLFNGVMFKSLDGGSSWLEINSGLPLNISSYSAFVFPAIVVNPQITSEVFLGTAAPNDASDNGNVYHTNTGGLSWQVLSDNWDTYSPQIAKLSVNNLLVGNNAGSRSAYAATNDGIFKLSDVVTGVDELPSGSLPKTFSLFQSYPNPFNPSTIIRFDVPKPSQVSIKIYDLLGRKVRTVVDRKFEAGRFTEFWDSTDDFQVRVATGLYFMRMQSDGFNSVKKLVLVK
jgi:hypothetical protein